MIEALTAALVVITACYAWTTCKILKANQDVVEVMREQSEALTRPYVTITLSLEADNPIFFLSIKNTGKTAARDLKLSIDRPFHQFGTASKESNISDFDAFTQPIESFPPECAIVFALAQGFVLFAEDADESILPKAFSVIAEYTYGLDKRVKETTTIDLRPYSGAGVPQEAVVRKLGDMTKALNNISLSIEKKELAPGALFQNPLSN